MDMDGLISLLRHEHDGDIQKAQAARARATQHLDELAKQVEDLSRRVELIERERELMHDTKELERLLLQVRAEIRQDVP